jgi:hypothetical protein
MRAEGEKESRPEPRRRREERDAFGMTYQLYGFGLKARLAVIPSGGLSPRRGLSQLSQPQRDPCGVAGDLMRGGAGFR